MAGKALPSWSERDLVFLAQDGDLNAFDQLVHRYRPGAEAVARGLLRSRDSVDDAVQEAFVAAYKALPRLRAPDGFSPWLGAIVRHACHRTLAGNRRNPLALDRFILAHAPSVTAELDARQARAEVRCAVERLPEELRACVDLYYFADWPVAKIASFLALPETTVKWRLHAARSRLRALLADDNDYQTKETLWN